MRNTSKMSHANSHILGFVVVLREIISQKNFSPSPLLFGFFFFIILQKHTVVITYIKRLDTHLCVYPMDLP